MIHQPLSSEGVCPRDCKSFALFVRLVRHTLLFVYFFKELISVIGSLDKCHICVFNALIIKVTITKFICLLSTYDMRSKDKHVINSILGCTVFIDYKTY